MYTSFSTDMLKVIITFLLVTIIFSLAGAQAASIYYGLFIKEKKPATPLYVFPVPKPDPVKIKKSAEIEKKTDADKKEPVDTQPAAVKKEVIKKKTVPEKKPPEKIEKVEKEKKKESRENPSQKNSSG